MEPGHLVEAGEKTAAETWWPRTVWEKARSATDTQVSSCFFNFIHKVKDACYLCSLGEYCPIVPDPSGETSFCASKFIPIRKKLEAVSYVRNFHFYCHFTENGAKYFLLLRTNKQTKNPPQPQPKNKAIPKWNICCESPKAQQGIPRISLIRDYNHGFAYRHTKGTHAMKRHSLFHLNKYQLLKHVMWTVRCKWILKNRGPICKLFTLWREWLAKAFVLLLGSRRTHSTTME